MGNELHITWTKDKTIDAFSSLDEPSEPSWEIRLGNTVKSVVKTVVGNFTSGWHFHGAGNSKCNDYFHQQRYKINTGIYLQKCKHGIKLYFKAVFGL